MDMNDNNVSVYIFNGHKIRESKKHLTLLKTWKKEHKMSNLIVEKNTNTHEK